MKQLKDIHKKIDKLGEAADRFHEVVKMNLETLKNDIQQLIDDDQPGPSNSAKRHTNNRSRSRSRSRTRAKIVSKRPSSAQKEENTSKKSRNFLTESIENKRVDAVPGVGPQAKNNLEKIGISSAKKLLGKALLMDKDEFVDYLMIDAKMIKKHAQDAWKNLMLYQQSHLD